MIRLALVFGIVITMISFGQLAHADGQKLVCVYQPMDLFMDKTLPGLIVSQVQTHGVNVKTVRIIDQILGHDSDCNVVIKIDRAINENYRYTDKTTKYQVVNNTITIFTYKSAAVYNPTSGETLKPMTNWSCETTAHVSRYHNNYQISNSGYYETYTGYCDPFKGSVDPSKVGELPYNVIQGSVDSALLSLGL